MLLLKNTYFSNQELKKINESSTHKCKIYTNKNFSYAYQETSINEKALIINGSFIYLDGFFFDKANSYHNVSEKLIKKLFEKYRNEELDQYLASLDGFFSLVIYDNLSDKISLYSDHIGSKELFFVKNDYFYVSTELENIKLITNNFCLDKNVVIDYFKFFNRTSGKTFYKNILSSESCEKITFRKNTLYRNEYFSFDTQEMSLSEDDFCFKFKETFLSSLSGCTGNANENIGTTFSGGLDSSSILFGLSKSCSKKIYPKTAVYKNLNKVDLKRADESYYVKEAMSLNNIVHEYVQVDNIDLMSKIDSSISIHSQPASIVNEYVHDNIFKSFKKSNINFILDGFGGDSVIDHGYGYLNQLANNFKFGELFAQSRLLHEKRNAKFSRFKTLKKHFIEPNLPGKISTLLFNFRKSENRFEKWLKRVNKKYRRQSVYNEVKDFYGFYPGKKEDRYYNAHEQNIRSKNITTSVRAASQLAKHYNLELRFPYLSKNFINLSLSTPLKFKLMNGTDRYIFRKSMEGIVPKKLLDRTSKADLSSFSKNEISQTNSKDYLTILKDRVGDIFDYDYLENVILNDSSNFVEIFQLIEFAKWLELKNIDID